MNDSLSSLPDILGSRSHEFSLKKQDKAYSSSLSLFASPRKAVRATSSRWRGESSDGSSVQKKTVPGKTWKIGLPFAQFDKKKAKQESTTRNQPIQAKKAPSFQSMTYTPVVTSLLTQPTSSSGPRKGAPARSASCNPSPRRPDKKTVPRKGPGGGKRAMLQRGASLKRSASYSSLADTSIPEDRTEHFRSPNKSEELCVDPFSSKKKPEKQPPPPKARGVVFRKSNSWSSSPDKKSMRVSPVKKKPVERRDTVSLKALHSPSQKKPINRRDTMSLKATFISPTPQRPQTRRSHSYGSPTSSPKHVRGPLPLPKSPSRKGTLSRSDGISLSPKKDGNCQYSTPVSTPKRDAGQQRPPVSPSRLLRTPTKTFKEYQFSTPVSSPTRDGGESPPRPTPDRRAALLKRHTSLPANASPKAANTPLSSPGQNGTVSRSPSLTPKSGSAFSSLHEAIAGYDDIYDSCQSLTTVDSTEEADSLMDSFDESLGLLLGGGKEEEDEEEELLF